MADNDLHVIFGAGPLGLAVMDELVARGRRVRVVTRSGRAAGTSGVEVVRGDGADPASAREVCRGAGVVYHCANAAYTEWPEKLPPLMQGILEGAASAGAKLVYGDNLYLYGPVRGPMTEDLPSAAATVKGRVRAQVAAELLAAHEVGRVRATIGRASDFYGPRVLASTLGEQVFGAALAGKPANLLGNVDLPHTYTYIGDFARGLVTLGERDEALGWAWHVPSAETRTTRELVEMIYREAGHPAKIRVAGRTLVAVMSWFSPMMRELREMLYQFEAPFVMDGSRFDRAFAAVATPHEEAVRRTMAWYRSRMAGKSLSESSGR